MSLRFVKQLLLRLPLGMPVCLPAARNGGSLQAKASIRLLPPLLVTRAMHAVPLADLPCPSPA